MLSVTNLEDISNDCKINLFAAAPDMMKCANCINLHVVEAREHGVTEQRIYLVAAWQDAPCYSERERAALAWGDALTRLSEGREHNAAYEVLKAHFTAGRPDAARTARPTTQASTPGSGTAIFPPSGA
jgi:AhpD family alkylhydroperoxidase